jgi:hypothetical protein
MLYVSAFTVNIKGSLIRFIRNSYFKLNLLTRNESRFK